MPADRFPLRHARKDGAAAGNDFPSRKRIGLASALLMRRAWTGEIPPAGRTGGCCCCCCCAGGAMPAAAARCWMGAACASADAAAAVAAAARALTLAWGEAAAAAEAGPAAPPGACLARCPSGVAGRALLPGVTRLAIDFAIRA